MPDPEKMRAAALKYFSCFESADVDGIVALFADDAVVEDPVGSTPNRGIAAIRKFFEAGFVHVGGGFRFEPEGNVRVAERAVACAAIATVEKADPPFRMETLDVWTVNEDGKFTSMKAYYGPTNVHALSGDARAAAEAARKASEFVAKL
jgi:steroid delta-isomerase